MNEKNFKRATIFAKAYFEHPSPSKRQKSRGDQCLRHYARRVPRITYAYRGLLVLASLSMPGSGSHKLRKYLRTLDIYIHSQ